MKHQSQSKLVRLLTTAWKKIEMKDSFLRNTLIGAVFAILGWMFLVISGMQVNQGLTHYQMTELKKTQEVHSTMLEKQLVKLTIISDKLHNEFGW